MIAIVFIIVSRIVKNNSTRNINLKLPLRKVSKCLFIGSVEAGKVEQNDFHQGNREELQFLRSLKKKRELYS